MGMVYRSSADRVLDYEEIIMGMKGGRSRRWQQQLQTQAARCMNCGTPTCHYPNQGGGGCPLSNRIPTWNQVRRRKELCVCVCVIS